MTEEGRTQAARDEIEQADEELRAAEHLIGAGFARIALARVYFAVFHAVRALLFARDLEPRSHAGVQHLFNLHCVKPGEFEPAHGRMLARLQKYREEADYARAFVVDGEGAQEELDAARALIDRIRADLPSGPQP